jgi:hypothetical protein
MPSAMKGCASPTKTFVQGQGAANAGVTQPIATMHRTAQRMASSYD